VCTIARRHKLYGRVCGNSEVHDGTTGNGRIRTRPVLVGCGILCIIFKRASSCALYDPRLVRVLAVHHTVMYTGTHSSSSSHRHTMCFGLQHSLSPLWSLAFESRSLIKLASIAFCVAFTSLRWCVAFHCAWKAHVSMVMDVCVHVRG
jgi:hypothetical protein